MPWPRAIHQTPPLASGDHRDERAPAIAEGAPFGDSTNRAIAEETNRKRLHEQDPTTVTHDEIAQSRRRRIALETTEAQITHGMDVGAVLAAVQAIQTNIQANGAAIQDIQTNIQANGAAIQAIQTNIQANGAAIQAIQTDIQAIQTNMQAMQASIQNLRHREKSRNYHWTPLFVERPGANPIGVVPLNHPQSQDDVFNLQHAQITALEGAFNLPRGHFNHGGTNLASRRAAVLEYILEG